LLPHYSLVKIEKFIVHNNKLIMNCHVATYSKFQNLLLIYELPHDMRKLGIEHFWPNCVMSYDNQGLGSLT
jgi:hypothetical protein